MKLQRIYITPAQFGRIPPSERALLVLFAHILNEVNTLNKLLACCAKIEPGPDWQVHAGNCQAMLLCRTLVGKLSEAWSAMQEGFFRSRLSESYEPALDHPAKEALLWLKSYFGKRNLINTVRNSFSFHYSIDHAKRELPSDAQPEELVLYLHKWVGNSLYQYAEYVMGSALLETIEQNNLASAMDRLLSEMSTVVGKMNEFFQGAMIAILDKHLGQAAFGSSRSEIDVPNVPQLANVRIPFFIEVPMKPPTESAA